MTTLREVILFILERRPNATDRQLSEAIYGSDRGHQQINQECRLLEGARLVQRAKSPTGSIKNHLAGTAAPSVLRIISSTE